MTFPRILPVVRRHLTSRLRPVPSFTFVMREVITLHLGQAGCQLGENCWELFCLEHGIDPEGAAVGEGRADEDNALGHAGSFFAESRSGRRVPRALFVDLEPTVLDATRAGGLGRLFRKEHMLSG